MRLRRPYDSGVLSLPSLPQPAETPVVLVRISEERKVVRRRNVDPQTSFSDENLYCDLCCISVVIGNVGFDRLLGPGCGEGAKGQLYLCMYCMMGMITRLDMHEAGIPSWD